jgi:geranylgeranyl diphosphate synthase, type I
VSIVATRALRALPLASPSTDLAPPSTDLATDLVSAVEWTLADFLTGEVAALTAADAALGAFGRAARDSVLAGGKRLRPTFAYWGWRGLAGPQPPLEPVLPALAALELLHAFALVHDDVMDDSATRRGRPTAHRVFAEEHTIAGRRGDPERFGRSAAILVGDLCLVWADRLMGEATGASSVLPAARRRYDQMRVEAIAGQYLDVLGDAEAARWSVERALRVARHKTASYTVLRPLQFGAALAGAGPERTVAADRDRVTAVEAAYGAYGVAVGEAFQLRDDLLGAYGDPAATGKPAGDDLRAGKPTVLLTMARRHATRTQRAALETALEATLARPDEDPARLRALISQTGADQRVEEMIAVRERAALDALNAAPIDPAARRGLVRLARAAAHRTA